MPRQLTAAAVATAAAAATAAALQDNFAYSTCRLSLQRNWVKS